MFPAVEAVFNTTELLESILHKIVEYDLPHGDYDDLTHLEFDDLPYYDRPYYNHDDLPYRMYAKELRTLLLAQRVCRKWKAVIQESSQLQKALYFQPIDLENLTPKYYVNEYGQQSAGWFTKSNERCQLYTNPLLTLIFGVNAFESYPNCGYTSLWLSWQRPEASWRHMLVTQPGVQVEWIHALSPNGIQDISLSLNTREERAEMIRAIVDSKNQDVGALLKPLGRRPWDIKWSIRLPWIENGGVRVGPATPVWL